MLVAAIKKALKEIQTLHPFLTKTRKVSCIHWHVSRKRDKINIAYKWKTKKWEYISIPADTQECPEKVAKEIVQEIRRRLVVRKLRGE